MIKRTIMDESKIKEFGRRTILEHGTIMIKYKATDYLNRIEKVEIERETDKSVWYKSQSGRMMTDRKVTNDIGFFDTWEEGKEFLLKLADNEVQRVRKSLEYYKAKYGNVAGLRRPENE